MVFHGLFLPRQALKRIQDTLRHQVMGSAHAGKQFWKEMKKALDSHVPIIDGISGDPELAEHWSSKSQTLRYYWTRR